MKVAAIVSIGYDDAWLPYSLAGFYGTVDRVYLLLSNQPWRGKRLDSATILSALKSIPDPDKKIKIVHGSWSNERQQRNYGLSLFSSDKFDMGLIVDPDEVYDPSQLRAGLEFAKSHPSFNCFDVAWYTYWKDVMHRIDPMETFRPTALVRRGALEFARRRTLKEASVKAIPSEILVCHHLSYVRSDSFILDKLSSLASGQGSSFQNWFDNVWKAWDHNNALQNLHPTEPGLFQRTVIQPRHMLPPVLRSLYREPESLRESA